MVKIDGQSVEWHLINGLSDYQTTSRAMEKTAAAIRAGEACEQVWLLQHPPLYTAGTSARPQDLLSPNRLDLFETGRGGQYTYHGPGQRICYVMLDLDRRGRDVRALVKGLERWVISSLLHFGIKGELREGRIGVWVMRPDRPPLVGGAYREDKIAAIGIRVRRWVSFHGISLNVNPDLSHYAGIVPCGIDEGETGLGVTSLHDLGHPASMEEVDAALKTGFKQIFAGELTETAPLPWNGLAPAAVSSSSKGAR